jgi:hypothetical protein
VRLKLIACEVLFREMCQACATSPHQVDVEFLPKGLHDLGGIAMAAKIQKAIDRVPEPVYDAILLGYGLCGNGLDGIAARHTKLVLPRAHDCIALLMGSTANHQDYFDRHPGAFYRSTGWIERGKDLQQLSRGVQALDQTLDSLIERYGEENGRYLHAELNRYQSQYTTLVFIETGLEAGGKFIDQAAAEAATKGWAFERVPGNLQWLRGLVSGDWPHAEFVTAPPGYCIRASYDTGVVQVQK